MDGWKRTVQVGFRVTEEEWGFNQGENKAHPHANMEAYLWKMEIDGDIIQVDLTDIKIMTVRI